jgi:hypothetical protein
MQSVISSKKIYGAVEPDRAGKVSEHRYEK